MEEIIASGKADVVEMARALLADPELPNKVMAGREDEIVRCLRCFTCMAERPTTGTRRCTVNPLIGRECEGTEVLPAARKKRVVVVGGGVAGCECAVHLGMEGKTVHLVEMRDQLAVDCNIRHRPILMQMVDKYTTVHLKHAGLRVTGEGLVCKDEAGNEVLIPGSTVICAVGQRSNRTAVDELRTCAPWVREIGDCVRVSNITNSVYQGYHAALDI